MITPRFIPVSPWHTPPACYPAGLSADRYARRLIEIGPGRGDFLFHLAQQHRDALVCGIEIKWRRFAKLCARRDRSGAQNLLLLYGDARETLPQFFTPSAPDIDAIYIQFPDPWPKRRHGHHRLMNGDFLRTCAQALRPEGELWFVTDAEPYAHAVATLVSSDPRWQSRFPHQIVTDCADAYPTHFAQKWRAEGRTIYYQWYWKNTC